MKVLIERKEGYAPHVKVYADWETANTAEVIDEWIRNLRLAKAWLQRKEK
jgi:hypothetical protein